jgi:hypothetical protein
VKFRNKKNVLLVRDNGFGGWIFEFPSKGNSFIEIQKSGHGKVVIFWIRSLRFYYTHGEIRFMNWRIK